MLNGPEAQPQPPLPQPKPVRPFPPPANGGDYHDELAQPPVAKAELFRNNGQWTDYRAALNRLPGLGRNEAYTLMQTRSEERRVGNERASSCRSRWSPQH